MRDALAAIDLVAFLNGNIFGYLLHAGEVAIAELLFGISLKKRKYFAVWLSVSLAVYLGMSLGFGLLLERFFPYGSYVISFFFSILLFPVCYKDNFWDELFCIVAGIAMQNFSYSTSVFIVGCCGVDPIVIHPFYSVLQVVIYAGTHAAVLLLCAKRLKDIHGAGAERLAMVLLSFVLTVVVYIMQRDRQSLSSPDFLWWRAMFICYDILTLFMLFGMYDRNKLRRENAILDSLRASEARQYELEQRAIEMVNIKCHDLKHQLIALQSREGSERQQALKEMENAVLIYDSIAKTGCKPLDVILSNKYWLCERYGIRLTYMIDGDKLGFMKATDVYSLFGNALDNAIRAETGVERDKRMINLTASAKGSFVNIHIENYFDGSVELKDGLPVTTQEDVDNHGFGMISMKRIVENYGGVMSVEASNKIFSVSMTIPGKP